MGQGGDLSAHRVQTLLNSLMPPSQYFRQVINLKSQQSRALAEIIVDGVCKTSSFFVLCADQVFRERSEIRSSLAECFGRYLHLLFQLLSFCRKRLFSDK